MTIGRLCLVLGFILRSGILAKFQILQESHLGDNYLKSLLIGTLSPTNLENSNI